MGRKRKTDRLYLKLESLKIETSEPRLGEVRTGYQRGLKGAYFKYIWAACEKCGKPRWVQYHPESSNLPPTFCHICANSKRGSPRETHPLWKGGRKVGDSGYVFIQLAPDDFFYPMAAAHGYVREHRLVMAKHLGRCLWPWEIVHHLNHDRADNRLDNLQLVTDMQHKQMTKMEMRLHTLEKRVLALEIDNALLKLELDFWSPRFNKEV